MVEIRKIDTEFRGLFASKDIDAGKIILVLSGNYFDEPTRTSIQIESRHLEHYEAGYMNHHCEPSAEVIVNSREHAGQGTIEPLVLAKRDIMKGEEVTFEPEQISVWEDMRDGSNSAWASGWAAPPTPEDGKWNVSATFNEPGNYVLRVWADDGGLMTYEDVNVVVNR